MIHSVIWRVILLAILIVTTGVQLDRQVRKTPEIADLVPGPFRSAAQFRVAAYSLAEDTPEQALEEARLLVERRPLPAEHLRILAQAQAKAGAAGESAITIQYAAQRGWRDPLAQEAMLRLAVAAGDTEEASRRLAALIVGIETDEELLIELAPLALGETGSNGRRKLAEIVSGADSWQARFLSRGARIIPADAYLEILGGSIANGTKFDCALLERSLRYVRAPSEETRAALSALVDNQC